MNLDVMRSNMNRYRELVSKEALHLKLSSMVLEKLNSFYRQLPSNQVPLADLVLSEWVLSDDEGVRFDALFLIDCFSITAAEPALNELSKRLMLSDEPGAPYERQKVIRIQQGLLKR